jgi:uncharacterized protein YggE
MVLLTLLAWSSASAQAVREGQMQVLGRATIEVVPDRVSTRVGVVNRDITPKAALDRNSAAARRIIAFAKSFGIADEDIQTDSVSLTPIYKVVRDRDGNTTQAPDGYSASNQVRVRLKDIAQLGEFMRQVLDHGATNVAGVHFELSDPSKAVDEALAKAVADAQRKAKQLAQAARVKLGAIREILHPPRIEAGRGPMPVAAASPRGAGTPVPIESGTVPISAEVDVIWRIE